MPLRKKLLHLNEDYMKILMRLDALDISSDRSEMRALRKALVVRVHEEMKRADKAIKICDELSTAIVAVDAAASCSGQGSIEDNDGRSSSF